MSLYAVMTSKLKVMRVMTSERGAKRYATKRGLPLVGLMSSPRTVSELHYKDAVWHGLTRENGSAITARGWASRRNLNRQVSEICRGKAAIAAHFEGGAA